VNVNAALIRLLQLFAMLVRFTAFFYTHPLLGLENRSHRFRAPVHACPRAHTHPTHATPCPPAHTPTHTPTPTPPHTHTHTHTHSPPPPPGAMVALHRVLLLVYIRSRRIVSVWRLLGVRAALGSVGPRV
jgi:hypothetical protein